MNCPFTHTSCDKECGILDGLSGCLFRVALNLYTGGFHPEIDITNDVLSIVERKPNAKSTRKKVKSPSKEKRVRKATD